MFLKNEIYIAESRFYIAEKEPTRKWRTRYMVIQKKPSLQSRVSLILRLEDH